VVVTFDACNVQLVGNSGLFGCRPWSVLLAKLVNWCGEGGQVAGVLHVMHEMVCADHVWAMATTLRGQRQSWCWMAIEG